MADSFVISPDDNTGPIASNAIGRGQLKKSFQGFFSPKMPIIGKKSAKAGGATVAPGERVVRRCHGRPGGRPQVPAGDLGDKRARQTATRRAATNTALKRTRRARRRVRASARIRAVLPMLSPSKVPPERAPRNGTLFEGGICGGLGAARGERDCRLLCPRSSPVGGAFVE